MGANPRRHVETIVYAAALLSMIFIKNDASAALTENSFLETRQTNHETNVCQAGLKFGITANRIPAECSAYLVKTLVTARSRKEKWQYRDGYLFFDNGILIAIRQMHR